MEQVEQKLMEVLLTQEHLFLLIGIFSFLLTLRWVRPVKEFLFSDKWKWLIAPLNLSLSCLGVFALGMTTVTTLGMKVVIALLASAVVTLTYEGAAKYLIAAIENWVRTKFGKSPA